ncbi:unnamed protein product [Rhizophagus irregularis]|nr:unnamed protein product [Rhizophagus irregularis]CAB4403498.1 unnamed protein product [Rhizophagus irregularis]
MSSNLQKKSNKSELSVKFDSIYDFTPNHLVSYGGNEVGMFVKYHENNHCIVRPENSKNNIKIKLSLIKTFTRIKEEN